MIYNKHLINAKTNKNDTWFTLYEDIDKELIHYKEFLKDKIIYCNCDNPLTSNFCKFFIINFNNFEIKRLICTCYKNDVINTETIEDFTNKRGLYIDISVVNDNENVNEFISKNIKQLNDDGNFNNKECINFLMLSDVIISNPPFSKIISYLKLLLDNKKYFLIVSPKITVTRKYIIPYFKEGIINYGYNNIKEFYDLDGKRKKFGNITWITNFNIHKPKKHLNLNKKYYGNENLYPFFYNAKNIINVNKVKDIPIDYNGIMAVPVSFLDFFDKQEFEILGFSDNKTDDILNIDRIGEEWINLYFKQGGTGHYTANMHNLVMIDNGVAKAVFKRVFIKKII